MSSSPEGTDEPRRASPAVPHECAGGSGGSGGPEGPPEGNDVERLSAHLARAPAAFLAPVDPVREGAVRVDAIVADLFRARADRPLTAEEIARFRYQDKAARRHLSLVAVASWLLYDPVFQGVAAAPLYALLAERLPPLAELVQARAFVEDAERREELVRTCLAALGILPAGTSAADAEDRLATLDSVRREALLRDARAREDARAAHKKELERLRREEEEERRKAARTTFED